MATVLFPIVFIVLGGFLHATQNHKTVVRFGDWCLFAGIFWLCQQLSSRSFHF